MSICFKILYYIFIQVFSSYYILITIFKLKATADLLEFPVVQQLDIKTFNQYNKFKKLFTVLWLQHNFQESQWFKNPFMEKEILTNELLP